MTVSGMTHPEIACAALGVVLIFGGGFAMGWRMARTVTAYMLGGRR